SNIATSNVSARQRRHSARPSIPPGVGAACWSSSPKKRPNRTRRDPMSGINVYGIPGSPFLRSVEVALKEKGLAYLLHPMAPGEHKTEEHLKRHPFGRIPAFEHDGLALYETQAIIRYLDDRFAHPPLTPG